MNVLQDFPQGYRFIPINGGPYITDNNIYVMQDCPVYKDFDDIIDASGYLREIGKIFEERRPLEFETNELKRH